MKNNEYIEDGNFFLGLMWATLLSVPLWISFFGWIKVLRIFWMKI